MHKNDVAQNAYSRDVSFVLCPNICAPMFVGQGNIVLGSLSFEMSDQSWCHCGGFVLGFMGALCDGFVWFSLVIIVCHGVAFLVCYAFCVAISWLVTSPG